MEEGFDSRTDYMDLVFETSCPPGTTDLIIHKESPKHWTCYPNGGTVNATIPRGSQKVDILSRRLNPR